MTDPTCTDGGYTTYTCTRCGDTYTADETDALGHDYKAVVTDPTCLVQGYTTHTCTRCDDSFVDTYVDALGHDFGEWAVTTEPTCLAKGEETRECSRCDATETRDVDALGHNYVAVVTEPTCLDAGYTTHTCSRCGDSYKDTPVVALGHDFGGWTQTAAPTCTDKGEETRYCSRCDATETRDVNANGHTPLEAVKENETAPTYDEEGGYDLVVYCDVCGDEIERTHVAIPRLTDVTVTDDPSDVSVTYRSDAFTDEATLVVIRVLDEAERAEVNALLPAGFYKDTVYEIHMEVGGVETQPANAVTVRVPVPEGYVPAEITVFHIADDNTVTPVAFTVVDGMLVFNTESFSNYAICATHTPGEAEVENKVDATCTDAGSYDSVVYCSVCGAELSRESGIEIPAKGHVPGETMTENIVPATCMAEGSYDEAVYCAVCGEELSRNTITVPVDPDAHVWGEWTVSTAGSCTDDAVEIRFCTCNAAHYETRISAAPGHTWGEWVTVREASPDADGLERRTCLVCGETEEREIRWIGDKTRIIQFVVTGSMHYVVHFDTFNYEIYSKQTPAFYWYEGVDLSFDIVLHSDCNYENYIVTLNDKELKQNADGTYTIPGGKDYAKININPVATATDDGGSGSSHTASVCKYCGKVHPGNFWGAIVGFFHAIFYFFKHLFG